MIALMICPVSGSIRYMTALWRSNIPGRVLRVLLTRPQPVALGDLLLELPILGVELLPGLAQTQMGLHPRNTSSA